VFLTASHLSFQNLEGLFNSNPDDAFFVAAQSEPIGRKRPGCQDKIDKIVGNCLPIVPNPRSDNSSTIFTS
jgi:hypothetical protein